MLQRNWEYRHRLSAEKSQNAVCPADTLPVLPTSTTNGYEETFSPFNPSILQGKHFNKFSVNTASEFNKRFRRLQRGKTPFLSCCYMNTTIALTMDFLLVRSVRRFLLGLGELDGNDDEGNGDHNQSNHNIHNCICCPKIISNHITLRSNSYDNHKNKVRIIQFQKSLQLHAPQTDSLRQKLFSPQRWAFSASLFVLAMRHL